MGARLAQSPGNCPPAHAGIYAHRDDKMVAYTRPVDERLEAARNFQTFPIVSTEEEAASWDAANAAIHAIVSPPGTCSYCDAELGCLSSNGATFCACPFHRAMLTAIANLHRIARYCRNQHMACSQLDVSWCELTILSASPPTDTSHDEHMIAFAHRITALLLEVSEHVEHTTLGEHAVQDGIVGKGKA